MVSVSIVNVTSYTGLELLRLLAQHPQFVLTSVTGRSAAGKRLGEVFPHTALASPGSFASIANLVITEEPEQTDLAFVCLPHAAAAESVVSLLERGIKVVDLSADFRLRDVAIYEEWYKHTHPAPALLESAVYGLCERYRERIASASLVANPGCYATAAILALLPAVSTNIIAPDLIIDAKSGISGAGRSPTLSTHYAEANEDVSAYSLTGHRHLPEITQELEAAVRSGNPHNSQENQKLTDQSVYSLEKGEASRPDVGDQLRITFIPHLIPMTRGMLATCYADLKQDESGQVPTTEQVRSLYAEYYADEPFVRVVDQPPHTKWTYGSNACLVYPMVDRRTRRLLVISCLDNLVKGAAGQAIQNANRMHGLPETAGLPVLALYP
jgi:N-acetyl-gamma-glutamyl-phosphate reductase